MNDPIVIDTKDGIEHYRMAAMISALRIEITTGMKMSKGSLIKNCALTYGTKGKKKEVVFEEMLALYKEKYGFEFGSAGKQ